MCSLNVLSPSNGKIKLNLYYQMKVQVYTAKLSSKSEEEE